MDKKEKLCVLYDGTDNMYQAEASQVKIIYHEESKNFEKYIEQNIDKQIYVELKPKDFTKSALHRLQEIKCFDNWTLQIPVSMILDDKKKVDDIKFVAIKDCCNRYMFIDLIGNWEVLQFILSLKPSEVYITNILGFCLQDVQKECKDVGIRLIPNMAQTAWDNSPELTKFFIRPEDIEVYAPYVSGFDFVGDNAIQEVCYKVYSRGYWYGNLRELIIGFEEDLDSRRLPPQYGEYRLNCKKRCITGSRCHLCRAMKEFTETMEKTQTEIIPPAKRK